MNCAVLAVCRTSLTTNAGSLISRQTGGRAEGDSSVKSVVGGRPADSWLSVTHDISYLPNTAHKN